MSGDEGRPDEPPLSDHNGNRAAVAATDHGGGLRSGVRRLGDYSLEPRVLAIIMIAIPIGALSAVVAFALLRLIGLITNLVIYHRAGTALVAPGGGVHSPLLILLAPVAGGLVIGLMARFGSEKIRGHGMPEAIRRRLRTAGGRAPGRPGRPLGTDEEAVQMPAGDPELGRSRGDRQLLRNDLKNSNTSSGHARDCPPTPGQAAPGAS